MGTKEAPPFAMKESDGTWKGISIELWRQIAVDLNLKFEFRELAAAAAVLTITPEREKVSAWDFVNSCLE